jgi:hypothetical protein
MPEQWHRKRVPFTTIVIISSIFIFYILGSCRAESLGYPELLQTEGFGGGGVN